MSGLEGLLRGRILGGRYRIEDVIGRGGMGAVYSSVDERLGRRVAVKVITAAMGDDEESRRRIRARFHREARAAAGLPHHPNVVPVYDYGTDEELGLDYIVMELLEGHDLATRLQRAGALPLAAALRILREAARGLAVGHRAGLIHRDVKPGNIFLVRDQDELQVRVVDFGIAKLADDEDTANQLTQDGRIPHSPAYASPEQLRGLTQLTPASDVFSLGAVGFQLLTGERPFTEADRNRMSLGMPVPPPSLRSRNPAIPSGIEEAIQKALAFDPMDRFPDAGAMVVAVDQTLRELPNLPLEPYEPLANDVEPIHISPLTPDEDRTQIMDFEAPDDERTQVMDIDVPPTPAAKPTRGAAAASRAEPEVSVPPPARPGSKPVTVAPKKRSAAPWVWTFVLLALGSVGVWAFMEQGGAARFGGRGTPEDTLALDSAAVAVDSAVVVGPTAMELNQLGIQAYNSGNYQAALNYYLDALELDPANPHYEQNIGIAQVRLGRYSEAEGHLRRAIGADPGLADAYSALATVQLEQGDTTPAMSSLREFINRTNNARARAEAQRQLNFLQAEDILIGEPIDTATSPTPEPSTPPLPPLTDTPG